MDILSQFLEDYNIDVLYFIRKKELEKLAGHQEHYLNTTHQGNIFHDLSDHSKTHSNFYDLYAHSNISE